MVIGVVFDVSRVPVVLGVVGVVFEVSRVPVVLGVVLPGVVCVEVTTCVYVLVSVYVWVVVNVWVVAEMVDVLVTELVMGDVGSVDEVHGCVVAVVVNLEELKAVGDGRVTGFPIGLPIVTETEGTSAWLLGSWLLNFRELRASPEDRSTISSITNFMLAAEHNSEEKHESFHEDRELNTFRKRGFIPHICTANK